MSIASLNAPECTIFICKDQVKTYVAYHCQLCQTIENFEPDTDVLAPLCHWPPGFADEFMSIQPHFQPVVQQGKQGSYGKSSYEDCDEAKLHNCKFIMKLLRNSFKSFLQINCQMVFTSFKFCFIIYASVMSTIFIPNECSILIFQKLASHIGKIVPFLSVKMFNPITNRIYFIILLSRLT